MVSCLPLALSRAQLRQLTTLLAYVFDDEQEHAFNDPDAQRTHIYWLAVRPLALSTGFRTTKQLRAEESQWTPAGRRSRRRPRSRRAPYAQPTTRAR